MLTWIRTFFPTICIFAVPIALSPILFLGSKESSCVFCIAMLTCYWLTEVVPLSITSLLPMLLFPVLGIMSAKDTAQQYLKDTSMLLIITLIGAIAVEECQLHRRIALNVLARTGGRFHWTLLAFAGATAFVSFWLSDTASTALMLPIAIAALEAMELGEEEHGLKCFDSQTDVTDIHFEYPEDRATHIRSLSRRNQGIWKCLVLVCSHASLIGGTAIITSTAPNLIFKDVIESRYHEHGVKITYMTWMAFAFPPLVGYLLASWVVLQISFLGPRSILAIFCRPSAEEAEKTAKMQKAIRKLWKALGPMTFAEKSVLSLYAVMIFAWMFRDPGFMPGWSSLLDPERRTLISDSCVGILVVFAFFSWPRERPDILYSSKPPTSRKALLTWDSVHRKLPWSVVFLIGAGFAISQGVQKSGLSRAMTCVVIDTLRGSTPAEMQTLLTTAITFFTETMSNGATASIFIPIALNIAETLRLHPFYLAIPAAIAPSFAFMLPMATPPNAIVYETGTLRMWEMAMTGVFLNFLCIGVTVLNMNTWAYWFFDMGQFPEGIQLGNGTDTC
ncbi:hypothetical protein QR680_010911 [Steinernema hermaphroditum]|uniref:Uncharacterized protein n=1 Tax=Steinernema hermaphroditum TaxID=289476 RepID=A0AA39ISA0_9BILA|nr:hypothetical protein QR680_010911 [Steinernema hermaphroditum]